MNAINNLTRTGMNPTGLLKHYVYTLRPTTYLYTLYNSDDTLLTHSNTTPEPPPSQLHFSISQTHITPYSLQTHQTVKTPTKIIVDITLLRLKHTITITPTIAHVVPSIEVPQLNNPGSSCWKAVSSRAFSGQSARPGSALRAALSSRTPPSIPPAAVMGSD
jgi:hypothetical protein